MPTAQKSAQVEEIKERLTSSAAVILTDYRGLTVKEMQALRTKLREAGGEVKVYKNTLTELALRELALPEMDELLQGPTLFTFAVGDPVAPAKALVDFAKDHKQLELKGGFIERHVVGADSIKALASLPSREQLVATLLGTMNNPMSQFVRVLNGPAAAFARVLNAIAEQKTSQAA
jgi:large subunit ribosomal protein L10